MFKRSLFLSCVLAASMSAGLMGATSWDQVKDTVVAAWAPVNDKFTAFANSEAGKIATDTTTLEAVTAAARAFMVINEANSKHPGRVKEALTDLSRISNELLVLNNTEPQNKQSAAQLSLIMLDIILLCKHLALGKTKPVGDDKLRGIAKLIDTKILPGLEAAAAITRATQHVANKYDKVSKFASKINDQMDEWSVDYWCTFTIVAARLFSMMVNSGLSSKLFELELLAAIAYGLYVLDHFQVIECNNSSAWKSSHGTKLGMSCCSNWLNFEFTVNLPKLKNNRVVLCSPV